MPDETWFGFDFNKLCELCRCCASDLVQSGFQSSVWFCNECKERVESLNNEYGGCVIPIGRFASADRDAAVMTLNNWRRVVVRENLITCGFGKTEPLPLAKYLAALAEQPIDKRRASDRLCDLFEGSLTR